MIGGYAGGTGRERREAALDYPGRVIRERTEDDRVVVHPRSSTEVPRA